jgi:hypothetical protein
MSTEEKVSKFVELFAAIPDERQEWKIKHKPSDITGQNGAGSVLSSLPFKPYRFAEQTGTGARP